MEQIKFLIVIRGIFQLTKVLKQEEIRKDDNCVLHIIDKAGHNSNQDNPELVNQLIYSLLNRDK